MSILITQPILREGIKLLEKKFKVEFSNKKLTKNELIRKIKNKEALICSVNDLIDEDVIFAGNTLKIISNIGVGFNNINIDAANKKGILVTSTPNTLEQSVAEFVFGHILSFSRRIVEADNYIRQNKFKGWSLNLFLGHELKDRILGIIGFGKIGQTLIPIARGFGMKIIYNDRIGELKKYIKNPDIKYANINEVLRQSDFIVLLVSLNKETKHFITYPKIKLMKKDAVVINMSRGPVVCESDLVRALKEKIISGACLDVFEYEPIVSEELMKMQNTVLTPHLGSATIEARIRMIKCAAQNVIDVLLTGECKNIVNKK